MKPDYVRKVFLSLLLGMVFLSGSYASKPFAVFEKEFIHGYIELNIPGPTYDYREYFNSIPGLELLTKQEHFFLDQKSALGNYNRNLLKPEEIIAYDQVQYETDFNLQRISLEKEWISKGRKIPSQGLHELSNYKAWYSFFVKEYTSTNITPEEVFAFGQSEVSKVKSEIKRIQLELGFTDSTTFYRFLKGDTFSITNKKVLMEGFAAIDQKVRIHLPSFAGTADLPPVYPMEWPDAGANTPPGIYLNHENNPYGKDVFQFNFYNSKYNRRSMEWLYMHEAIPGHHLQSSFRKYLDDSLQQLFFYSGTVEGWACYVEYFGKEFGLYTDPYEELGKWEWDLVRSARLVIDAGIHYYGWTREQALDYWKKTIPGQDDIADREVTRVTNWTAQALSYKIGAAFIFQLKEKCRQEFGPAYDEKKFHRTILSFGMAPLEVIDKNFSQSYSTQKL